MNTNNPNKEAKMSNRRFKTISQQKKLMIDNQKNIRF